MEHVKCSPDHLLGETRRESGCGRRGTGTYSGLVALTSSFMVAVEHRALEGLTFSIRGRKVRGQLCLSSLPQDITVIFFAEAAKELERNDEQNHADAGTSEHAV